MLTQQEYLVLKQPIRHLNIKIDLINKFDIIVGSFEGIAIGGSITLDANSNYRRSGDLKMILNKKYNLLPSPSSKIWFNSRIGIYIGLKNFKDEVIWFNMGKFIVSEVDISYSLSEQILSCTLLDYCANIDGTLGGNLSHETRIIAQGVSINDAIKSTLTGLGKISLDNIEVDGSLALLPYDIEKSPNTTVYELVKELVDLYKNYEFYYDENGIFRLSQIKNRKNNPITWDFSDIDLSINYSRKLDFKNVKNSIWIWGKQLDNGIQVVWNYRNRYSRQTLVEMNNISDKLKGDICHVASENKSYMWNDITWELLNFTVVPQFNIESIGEKTFSLNENNIFNEGQAKLRCEYELQNYSNFAETVNFSTIPIYALKPNSKIRLNVDEIGINNEDYLIKNTTIPLDITSTSSIQAEKIYY